MLVFFRRRYPMTVATLITAAGFISSTASGPGVLAAVSLATRRVWWQLAVIGLLNLAASFTYNLIVPTPDNGPWWVMLVVVVVVTVGLLGWGAYIGSRRELIWSFRHRAERAEAEQELRATQARANERARIAREMHDVLAHRISQVSMHAGALAFRTDLDADGMRASATIIQDTAHQALADLRGVLGVLRDPETGAPLEPPTADVRRPGPAGRRGAGRRAAGVLRRPARDAGHRAARRDRPHRLPDRAGRHDQRRQARSRLQRSASRCTARPRTASPSSCATRSASASAPRPGPGWGWSGLTERTELGGGRLEGRREEGTWVLRGWIPWAA